jgi:hypothetical protein
LLFGVALGVAGTILVRHSVGPDLLSRFRSDDAVEGHVLDKALESDRLLLKIETEQGAFLATFTERQAEIDLLVDPGDTITLDVQAYQPFLADPAIARVRKPKLPMESEEPTVETGIEVEPQITEPQAVEPTAVPQETEMPS